MHLCRNRKALYCKNEGIENLICCIFYEEHCDYVPHINSIEEEFGKWGR